MFEVSKIQVSSLTLEVPSIETSVTRNSRITKTIIEKINPSARPF